MTFGVLLCFSQAFSAPGAVAVSSVARNLPRGSSIVVASTSLRADACRLLESLGAEVGIDVHTVDLAHLVEGLPTVGRYAPETWGPIFVNRVVDAERVLYLDADTLVLGSVAELENLSFDGHAMRALPDPVIRTQGDRGEEFVGVARPPRSAPYFNTGVLFIDVNRWREASVDSKVRQVVESGLPLDYVDQDALNAVMWDAWSPLEDRWHRMVDGSEACSQGAKIVHFVGAIKPWHESASPGRLRDLYMAEAEAVGWDLESDRRPAALGI